MQDGEIKRLKESFGFIRGTDGTDRFFHRSSLRDIEFHQLAVGMSVTFEDEVSDKGPRCTDVYVKD